MQLIVLVPLVGLFYLLLVRPQKKRLRQHDTLVQTLVPGDEVITIGGIIAYVKKIEDEVLYLEIAEGVVIRTVKQAIGRKVETPALDGDDAGAEGDAEVKHDTDDTE